MVTAMTMVAEQIGANRIVAGTRIPHPCGDPTVSAAEDQGLRREIVRCALRALQTDAGGPTVFVPPVTAPSG